MRIVVSVDGRFHAFDLARELEKRGHLLWLITSYPMAKERVSSGFTWESYKNRMTGKYEKILRITN